VILLVVVYTMGLTCCHNVEKTLIHKTTVDPIKEEDDNITTKVMAITTIIGPVAVVLATRTKTIFKANNNNNNILNPIQIVKLLLIFPVYSQRCWKDTRLTKKCHLEYRAEFAECLLHSKSKC
jgi:hypothetical protein